MEFKKYQCMGHEYLVFDCEKNNYELTVEDIIAVCNKTTGIGADGVLVGPIKNSEDAGCIGVRFFCADGREVNRSNRGIRVFAKYLKECGYMRKEGFSLLTLSGKIEVEYMNYEGTKIHIHRQGWLLGESLLIHMDEEGNTSIQGDVQTIGTFTMNEFV